MLGLYLHVPFCQSICGYCNFNRGLMDEALKRRYVDALAREIRGGGAGQPADTIFFGGGTPSLLEPHEVGTLLAACRAAFAVHPDAEVTLEMNPETATAARLAGFRDAGITRLSFGVQSFNDDELKRLGRVHSAARAIDAIVLAQAEGFASVSFDLMCWLPGQSLASWLETVDRAIALAPAHLSLYLLELYPNAPLKEVMARATARPATAAPPGGASPGDWALSSDDEAADMYLSAFERLDAAGLAQYEISNAARPGAACRHNLKYWQGGSWRGFGCGAHSTVEGTRWQNIASTAEYIDRIVSGVPVSRDEHVLSPQARLEEALFTGLRLAEGIDLGNFQLTFGVDPWSVYGAALEPCVDDGLMWRRRSRLGLTRRGMLVANEILATFV